ncbi:hypothetical protein BaRGS_00002349 [Batillaria attramentaria]|uniref:Uncharacterized protein n=1 Tax=Batillaria attramentaria TaxID=370345 RepID=A0ABD0M3I0_9CAEN
MGAGSVVTCLQLVKAEKDEELIEQTRQRVRVANGTVEYDRTCIMHVSILTDYDCVRRYGPSCTLADVKRSFGEDTEVEQFDVLYAVF